MKRFTRCMCIALAFIVCMSTPASATVAADTRASSFFHCSSVFLNKTSDTTFEVWFSVTALGVMDELGASLIKVQKSSDGENWTTMITYYKENNPQMICENTGLHGACVSYTGTPGSYYRAYVVLYAKKGTSIGETPEYTAVLKL